MKHSLSCAQYFRKITAEVEIPGNLSSLFYRQHLLTVSQYIHLVQCLFKRLSKYIKDPQPVNHYVEKKQSQLKRISITT